MIWINRLWLPTQVKVQNIVVPTRTDDSKELLIQIDTFGPSLKKIGQQQECENQAGTNRNTLKLSPGASGIGIDGDIDGGTEPWASIFWLYCCHKTPSHWKKRPVYGAGISPVSV